MERAYNTYETQYKQRLYEVRTKLDQAQLAPESYKAVVAAEQPPGGIDLNTANGMQWKVSKDGKGVEMDVDPAAIARIQREGINWLSPVILRMTPVTSIWPLMGLHAPA